jgi:hypothetical protein
VGVELGWMFADGEERRKLMQAFDESCRWAAALGCQTVMSASDRGKGDSRAPPRTCARRPTSPRATA